jgi:8-hydroxy-5-deazaflavin:NADPH oxidoreductase
MDIAVLGTGTVGRAIAGRLDDLGHNVRVGTREPATTRARTEPDGMGNPPFTQWQEEHPGVTLASYAEAAAAGEVVVLATSGAVALDVLSSAGAENLSGKPLMDITNPLDFSAGFPPTLSVKDTDSLGEQIQRAFPDARVVKTLNTVTAALMVFPGSLPGESTVFVSGEDPAAKVVVRRILDSFGHDDVIDLGGIETARGVEMWLPLWLRVMGALGTARFNLKIVR